MNINLLVLNSFTENEQSPPQSSGGTSRLGSAANAATSKTAMVGAGLGGLASGLTFGIGSKVVNFFRRRSLENKLNSAQSGEAQNYFRDRLNDLNSKNSFKKSMMVGAGVGGAITGGAHYGAQRLYNKGTNAKNGISDFFKNKEYDSNRQY